jgi:hypothetical protein
MQISDIVRNYKVYGLEDSVKASKYPMAVDTEACTPKITKRTKTLANCATGTGHDTFLNGIIVQFDLTFTLKAWPEAQRYHFLEFVSSQSTMHRITHFEPEKQCNEYVHIGVISILKGLIDCYNADPTPENYLRVLYNIPTGFRLTARMSTNYRQLKTIYQQRKNHRLPEWRTFCEWIKSLPHSELIIPEGEE